MNQDTKEVRTKVLQALAKLTQTTQSIFLRDICLESGLKPHVVANVLRWFKKYDIVSSIPKHEGWVYNGIKDPKAFCILHGYTMVLATGRGKNYKPTRCTVCEKKKEVT